MHAVYAQHSHDETPPEGDSVDRHLEDVETLRRYETLGFNNVILEFQWMEMPDQLAMKSLRLIGEHVPPSSGEFWLRPP